MSELKTELAAVERNIQLSIEPLKQSEEAAEQVEKRKESATVSDSIVRVKGIDMPRGVLQWCYLLTMNRISKIPFS